MSKKERKGKIERRGKPKQPKQTRQMKDDRDFFMVVGGSIWRCTCKIIPSHSIIGDPTLRTL